ncbi:unnamed protein product [Rotaria sp. Silwood1]|nr:unnamed protein product [Rotaria sp. Silwood1]
MFFSNDYLKSFTDLQLRILLSTKSYITKSKPCHAHCCLNTLKILSALAPVIRTGIPIIGCMAQITNISNSADQQSMIRSTTSSEDDINNQDLFLTPSLDINFSTNNDVVNQCTIIEINDSDSINTDLSQSTTVNIPPYDAYINLSTSSSEASLARPLLNDKNHEEVPSYTKDTKIKIPQNPNNKLTSNYYSFIKFYLTDMLMSAFIITPLVNIHWRGACDLLDRNLLSNNEPYINQWRGLWNLLDFTSNVWYHLLIETLISIILLLCMKSIYSLNSAPFLIGVDTESYFILGSKCNVSTNRFWQYTFDFIFYEIVEAPLVVIAWRGLYNLSDLYIYPDDKLISMLISFTIGYSLFFLLALLQIPIIQCLIKYHHKLIHAFISNLFHLIAFVSVVQIWRSLWMMCEQYINIPGYHHLTLWLCYIGAYILLTCGLTACSLNGPGGGKDNYIDDQPILLYKFDYFSTLLKSQSGHFEINKGVHLGPDSSSIETIMPVESLYRFEPP